MEKRDSFFILFLWATNLLLTIAIAAAVMGSLTSAYDWDLDHELYFGQQLAHGHLIWMAEYHDKLPFVQEMFLLPGAFANLRIWQFMSLTVVCVGILSTRLLLPRALRSSTLDSKLLKTLGWTGGLVCAYWIAVLPGGITGINGAATSLWLLAVLLGLTVVMTTFHSRASRISVTLSAGAVAACSASIRPYLVAPLLVMGVFIVVLSLRQGRPWRPILIYLLAGFLAAFLLCNFVPFVIVGDVPAFIDGIRMQLSDLNPTPGLESLLATQTEASWLMWISFAGSALCAVWLLFNRSVLLPICAALIASAVALMLFILRSHWWAHYAITFSGILALLFSFTLCALFGVGSGSQSRAYKVSRVLVAGMISLVAWQALSTIAYQGPDAIRGVSSGLRSPENSDSEIVKELKSAGIVSDFLVPDSMYVHWALGESRHGFPHAANTAHILLGWWKAAPTTGTFAVSHNYNEYCQLLWTRGPKRIIVPDESPLVTCLSATRSPFLLESTIARDGSSRLRIFARKP